MTTWATPYQAAYAPCSGKAQPGTIALSMVVEGLFPRTYNLGIYNCREVAGGGTWSIHSDGRAWDCGIPLLVGGRPDLALGDPILRLIAANAVALGVQCVIWNDTLYSARNPDGIEYQGVDPHYSHLHIEQQWYEAQNLSVAEVAAILRDEHGGEGGGDPIPPEQEDEDEPMRYITVIGDANTYGYTDDQWWIANSEEAGSFGGVRQVNARQRDVIKSRVASVKAGREASAAAVARTQAQDATSRALQAWIGGSANAGFSPAQVAAFKVIGARSGVLGDLFTATQPEGE